MVKVNGEMICISGKTVKELLVSQGYDLNRVAVEKNGEIVPKTQYESDVICSGDNIEIVSFVGGG